MAISQSEPFASFYPYQYIQLTTYRKSGVGMATIVWFAGKAGSVYVMSPSTAGKLKRIRNNGRATLAPCKFNGRVVGASAEGRAHILSADEQTVAHQALAGKYGLLYRIFLVFYKLRGAQPIYIEIELVQS